MSAAAVLTTFTEPAVAASSVLVWLPAALLATAAQRDRATGPAPRVHAGAARSALLLVAIGLGLAVLQLAAVGAVAAGWVSAPRHPAAWPALVASLTGAGLVTAGAVTPLLRLRRGRPVTEARQLRGLHAALRSAVAAGVVAALAVAVAAGLQPVPGSSGPYLAPSGLAAVAVLGVHAALRSVEVTRSAAGATVR